MSDPIETTYPIYNQYIYKQGIGWVLVGGGGGGDSLPDQTNNAGKFLTTDGTVASWGAVTPASIGALPDDTTAADIGAIPDSAAAAGITNEDITNWNNKIDVDEKVKQTPVNSENATKALLVGSSTEITSTINSVPNITYNDSSKTLKIAGTSNEKDLIINGESIKFRTINGNFQGALKSTTLTADRTYTLQNASGTLAFTSDIPSSLSELTNDPGFITTPNIPYLTCETAVGTAAKTTTLVSGSFGPTDLVAGAQVLVKFTNSNTAGSATLNVNGTGAKPLRRYGTTAAGTNAASSWQAGAIVLFIYDGSAWVMENWENTTYSTITDAEATAGTSTSSRLVTPALLKKAIQTWAIPIDHVVNGITQNDIDAWDAKVSDDHKWNDVELDKVTSLNGSGFKIPVLPAANSTTAYLVGSNYVPTAGYIAAYDSDKYLHSTTPAVNDTSNKVATTDFVSSALSTIEGVPSYGASDTGKVLKTDGVSAYWASIDSLLEYKGVKATAAALPSSGNTTGDVWIVEEDNSEYVWNGTAWEKFGPTIDLSGYVPTSRTINGKALTSNITLNYSDVGALADTVPAAGITNADITAWNNKPSVDEKVKQTPLNGVNSGKGLLFSSSTGGQETTSTAYTSNKLSWNDYSSVLSIYNESSNKYGYIKYDRLALANSSTSYSGYLQTASVTADRTYTLPDATGTLALTSQIPTSLAELTNDPGYAIITIRDWTSAS